MSKTKKASPKEHIHYHNDGTIWAKGKIRDGIMEGYWEWFRKDGTIMRPVILKTVNKQGSGQPTTKRVKCTK